MPPEIEEAKKLAADKALVTVEDVVKGLLEETKKDDDATTPTSRVSAWKALSDYTGGFDANKKKVELSGDKENPIAVLIHEISGNTLEPNSD